jgi:hypothetical protein
MMKLTVQRLDNRILTPKRANKVSASPAALASEKASKIAGKMRSDPILTERSYNWALCEA